MKADNIINKISVLLFLVLVICSVGFVLLRSNVVLNRYTDSWWHIAVADEYAKTGVFAKDPFIKDAPAKFAQFGLMDVDNAILCRIIGKTSMQMFSWCVAENVMMFLFCAFAAGYFINGKLWQGLVSAVTWMLLYPGQTIIDLGFPFATAVAMLGFFTVVMIVRRDVACNVSTARTIGLGILLGIIFDMHVFVGAVGCVMAVFWYMTCGLRSAVGAEDILSVRRIIWQMILFWGAFLLVAGRWIILQVGLRSMLSETNAHMCDMLPLDVRMMFVVTGLVIMLLLILITNYKRNRIYALMLYGILLIIFAVPPVNNFIMEHTSWYMAHRVLWVFPVGVVFAIVSDYLLSNGWRGGVFWGKIMVLLLAAIILLPSLKTWGMKQLFLARTNEYNHHPFEYLRDLQKYDLRDKVVLSDPVTSYYLRGMTGAYVCTVIPGEASPALDYAMLDKNVYDMLLSGLGNNVDAILIDIKNGTTEHFAGASAKDIIYAYKENSWQVAFRSDDMVLLDK